MKEQLQEAWRTNNKISLLFIEHIEDEAMEKTLSARGGRTVYEQLVHLHNVRMQWLDITGKEIAKKYEPIKKDAPHNKKVLIKAFEGSGKGIEEFIEHTWEKNGKVSSFKKGLIPFISYLMAHEA